MKYLNKDHTFKNELISRYDDGNDFITRRVK